MAFKIIWSEQARDDLQAIVQFIAHDNARAAESFGYLLISKVDVLARSPEFGRVVPEENDSNVREIIFRPYRIIYQIFRNDKVIAIVRVWHGARGEPDLPNALKF